MIQHNNSEGTPFAQRDGDSNKQFPPHDKNIGKICNYSYAYRKVTHNHIIKKQLPILPVITKVMTANVSRLNQVIPPKLTNQKV